jgi:hypothetical protein
MTKNTVIGTIEKVQYTSGSFGEQYVTIDGQTYMTYWNIDQLKRGSKVEIAVGEPRKNCFVGDSQVVFKEPQAEFLRFVEDQKA